MSLIIVFQRLKNTFNSNLKSRNHGLFTILSECIHSFNDFVVNNDLLNATTLDATLHLSNEKGFLVKKPYGKGRFPYDLPCRKVRVSSIRKLNAKMLFSRLEPAENPTRPPPPPTHRPGFCKKPWRRGETLPGRMDQPGFVHPPTAKETLLETWLYVSCWIFNLGTPRKLFSCSDISLK